MKLKYLLVALVSVFLILSSGSMLPATAQAPLDGELKLISAGGQEAVLELTVPDFQVETIDHEGQTYQQFVIPRMAQTHQPGDPQVPVRSAFLGVSSTEGVSVEVIAADYETLSGYRLYPAPTLKLIGQDIIEPSDIEQVATVFTLNQNRYAADAFYPGELAEIGKTGALRDQAVASVLLYPVQYNPARDEVRLYRRLVVQVTWSTAPSLQAAGQTRRASPTYEKVLRNTLLNYSSLDRSAAMKPAPLFDAGAISAASGTSTNALKVGVTEDGIYRLNPGDLSGNGFNLSGVSLSNIKLENQGAEIPIYMHDDNSNDAFDGSDYILFYGTAITDVYTTKNIYWLEEGSSAGARMSEQSVPPGSATLATAFPTTLHAEEDTSYWVVMPNGAGQDHWFWGDRISPATSGLPTFRDYSLTLNNISSSTATVRVRLKGYTGLGHVTRIYLNGSQIDEQSWSGQNIFTHEVSANYLQNGLNTVRVEARDSGDALPHQVFVNWIEIDYQDTYVAENDELLFGAPSAGPHKFSVTGFSSSDIRVFDVTNPASVAVLTDTTVAADGGYYKVQFEDTPGTDTRYLAALTTAQSPASIELDEPSDLKGANNGHYIIITHEDFYSSAQTLATHRASAATVKVEDIYDEFNYGIFNPQAIRDFISYADTNWGGDPAYILLLGGASYDYRDLLGLSRANFVPTQMVETVELGQTPSDNWFVSTDDDILPYMFIGRLTAQSSAEAADMVDKVSYYETNPPPASWNTNVLLVADDGNPADGDNDPTFEYNSEDLAGRLPGYYTANKVYLLAGQPDPPHPTTDVVNYINNGSLLVNYAGHGNVTFWAQEKIMEPADVAGLNNTNKLPVVTVANCLNGYFVGKNTSLAEEFMKRDNKGAVAVWADAGEGFPSQHRVLIGEFYDAIFQEDKYTLGEATWQAKTNTYVSGSTSLADLVATFGLFGDPAMQLGLPENYPYVESTTPANGATDVPLGQDIQIAFNKPMNPATVSLSGPGAAGFTSSWNTDNTTVTYTHADFPHSQTLTFSVSGQDSLGNPLGSGPVPTTWSFTTPIAPTGVSITGPAVGIVGAGYVFNAAVSPSTTTLPVTYVWQATSEDTVTHTNMASLNDSIIFNWDTPGLKTVTVTATNAVGSTSNTHSITIYIPPSSVTITGPTTGVINNAYTFNATVSPANTDQPITYVWQATGMAGQETHTGGDLDDSFTFTWTEPGLKQVTVTASNGSGVAVNKTYQIDIKAPPTGVNIAGPATGVVQVDYTFSAATSPSTASLPLIYSWQATGEDSQYHYISSLTDQASFNWDTPGTKAVTITVSNSAGSVTNNYFISVDYSPPTGLEISGPAKGAINTDYQFAVTTTPVTVTRPITYEWQTTGQSPVRHENVDSRNDTVTFNWDTPGTKTITATATNAGGTFSQTYEVNILVMSVTVTGPQIEAGKTGATHTDYTFNATLSPDAASQPVTYEWQATGQAPVTHTGGGLNDSATFNWDTPGEKEISVTATNAEGTDTSTYTITLNIPPSSIDITGPTTGEINTDYTFTATAGPDTAAQPITYEWQTTGQSSAADGGSSNQSATFRWDTPGEKEITVTASNIAGSVTKKQTITISDPAQSTEGKVYLPVVIK